MMKNRNEVIDYINNCSNCYCAVLGESGECKTLFVSHKRVNESIIVLAVESKEIEMLNHAANQNISVVIWDNLQGYQLKGHRVSSEEIPEHYHVINNLKEDITDTSNICFVLCSINDIYNVTPGKFAGKLVQ